MQKVVCAAIRNKYKDIICGPRHFDDTMQAQMNISNVDNEAWYESEQGFVDQEGNFLTRKEAYKVAVIAGQIEGQEDADVILISEDLY